MSVGSRETWDPPVQPFTRIPFDEIPGGRLLRSGAPISSLKIALRRGNADFIHRARVSIQSVFQRAVVATGDSRLFDVCTPLFRIRHPPCMLLSHIVVFDMRD